MSLISVLCKILEKIVLGVTEKQLKDSVVIDQSHYKFIRGRSCLTNLISFYEKVTHLVDQGRMVDVIFWISKVKLLILFLTVSFWTKYLIGLYKNIM